MHVSGAGLAALSIPYTVLISYFFMCMCAHIVHVYACVGIMCVGMYVRAHLCTQVCTCVLYARVCVHINVYRNTV